MNIFDFYNFFNVQMSEWSEADYEIMAISGNYNPNDAILKAVWILGKRIQKQDLEIQELKAGFKKG